jgi:uncharacterized protein (TIGR02145 family)
LPAGYRSYGGSFNGRGGNAYFWSSTEFDAFTAYGRGLNFNDAGLSSGNSGKTNGFSVRCLKD